MTFRLLGLLLLSSCSGELSLGGAHGGPGGHADGGSSTALVFRPTIQADLEASGCTTDGACHGGTVAPMPLATAPTTEDDWRANYDQVKARTGTAASSLLIDKATGAGGHLAALSEGDPELTRLRAWIEAGSPYREDSGADGGASAPDAGTAEVDATPAAGLTWERDVSPIMRARCTRCHGSSGAYSVESYGGAFGFGTDNIPNILPGDATSLLAQYCEQGHEGMPASDALMVIEWIVDWDAAER